MMSTKNTCHKNWTRIKAINTSSSTSSQGMNLQLIITNFEKLHLEITPTHFLPVLLKNNYLSDPALTLVRSLTSVEEIWERLKSAYGDTKMMLSRKLQSWDPQKLVIALSKYTNTIREVMLLAHQHRIEENLYCGNSLPKIYQQLGDSRLTRFTSKNTCYITKRKQSAIK